MTHNTNTKVQEGLKNTDMTTDDKWKEFANTHVESTRILCEQINDVTVQVETAINQIIHHFIELASKSSSQNQILDGLSEMINTDVEKADIAKELLKAGEGNKEMRGVINHLIEQLQFQDATKQRLEHISHGLAGLKEMAEETMVKSGWTPNAEKANQEFIEKMKGSYSMRRERDIHGGSSEGDALTMFGDDDSDSDSFDNFELL